MYQATNILDELNFDIMEYAYLTTKTHHSAGSFDLYIPKLMAPLAYGNKNSWSSKFTSPLKNASGCKVSPNTSITLQNYVNISRHLDTDFSSRADINGYLYPGQKFIVTLMNHDPRDIKILKIM